MTKVSNKTLHEDLNTPTVKEENIKLGRNYLSRLEDHPNHLAVNLLANSKVVYGLHRSAILELPFRTGFCELQQQRVSGVLLNPDMSSKIS
ncbi:hypothetical protein J6590_052550 [Homalodisca vitripennis]|nr:hypothetical protein J6590_052550 [Homalodisca vitripennis]